MMDWNAFGLGCAWILAGMWTLEWYDPEGVHDDLVMGMQPSWIQLGVSPLLWPLTLILMILRR